MPERTHKKLTPALPSLIVLCTLAVVWALFYFILTPSSIAWKFEATLSKEPSKLATFQLHKAYVHKAKKYVIIGRPEFTKSVAAQIPENVKSFQVHIPPYSMRDMLFCLNTLVNKNTVIVVENVPHIWNRSWIGVSNAIMNNELYSALDGKKTPFKQRVNLSCRLLENVLLPSTNRKKTIWNNYRPEPVSLSLEGAIYFEQNDFNLLRKKLANAGPGARIVWLYNPKDMPAKKRDSFLQEFSAKRIQGQTDLGTFMLYQDFMKGQRPDNF